MFKKLWKDILFPIVIGGFSALFMITISELKELLITNCFALLFWFVLLVGFCAANGFIIMYYTGPKGIEYKPLLACPMTYVYIYYIPDVVGFIVREEFASLATGLFSYLFFCGISYAMGFVGKKKQARRVWWPGREE